MDITESHIDDILIAVLDGRLNDNTSTALQDRLIASQRPDPRDVIVDLGKVIYMTVPAALGIVTRSRALRHMGKQLVLARAQLLVFSVFELNGFTSDLMFARDQNEALYLLQTPNHPGLPRYVHR